ncbi:MAG: sulfur carrier protein ThiS [Candidatus Margulisiibacteriota bacterium]|jgi:sulfur carrier protein
MIKIIVNGREWEVADETTIADLLGKFKVPSRACAVELNGRIIKRDKFQKTGLKEADAVEIIRMMGGG